MSVRKSYLFIINILLIVFLITNCSNSEDKIEKAEELKRDGDFEEATEICWDLLLNAGSQEKLKDNKVGRRAKQLMKEIYPHNREFIEDKLLSKDMRSKNLAIFVIFEGYLKDDAIDTLLKGLRAYNFKNNFQLYKTFLDVLVYYKNKKVIKPLIEKALVFPPVSTQRGITPDKLTDDVSKIIADKISEMGTKVIEECKAIMLSNEFKVQSPYGMEKLISYRVLENFKDKDPDVERFLKKYGLSKSPSY